MLNQWLVPIVEEVHGRKLRTLFGSSVDRTIRNHENGLTGEPRLTPDDLYTAASTNWPDKKQPLTREQFDSGLAAAGPLSAFFVSPASCIADRSALVEFATQIDRLSDDLTKARRADDFSRAKGLLADQPMLTAAYWKWPGTEDGRELLSSADTWEALQPIIGGLAWNLRLSTFALWDVCLHAHALKEFQPEPVFLFLAPRIKPEAFAGAVAELDGAELHFAGRARGMRPRLDTPLSLYFELLWWICRCVQLRDPAALPQQRPSLSEICNLLGALPEDVDRFRSGEKKLTLDNLAGLLPRDKRFDYFVDLAFAAQACAFTLLLRPAPSSERSPVSVLIVDEEYRGFWRMHREDGLKRGYAALGGNVAWPDFLRR